MTDQARRWRMLAEETFARADRIHDAAIREKIRGIAAGYERLAQLVERRGGRGPPDSKYKSPAPRQSKPHLEILAGLREGLRKFLF